MEKPNTAPIFLLFFLLGIVMPLVFYSTSNTLNEKKNEYIKNGTPVVCTVMQVSNFVNVSEVSAVYINQNGDAVSAYAVLRGNAKMYDSFEGYVLPFKPHTVFIPKDNMPPVSQAPVIVTTVIGWLLMILYLYINGTYNMLELKGRETDAELMSVERWGSDVMFGNFVFENEAGKIRSAKVYISRNLADVYEKYRICYYEMPDGRIEAASADERLNK